MVFYGMLNRKISHSCILNYFNRNRYSKASRSGLLDALYYHAVEIIHSSLPQACFGKSRDCPDLAKPGEKERLTIRPSIITLRSPIQSPEGFHMLASGP